MAELRRSLSMVLEQNAIPIPLHETKYGIRVGTAQDRGLFRTAVFVLAVNAQVSPEALRSGFAAQTKIGPVEKIRDLVNLHLPGVGLFAAAGLVFWVRYEPGVVGAKPMAERSFGLLTQYLLFGGFLMALLFSLSSREIPFLYFQF